MPRSRLPFPLLIAASMSVLASAYAAAAEKPMLLDLDHGSGAVTFDAIGKPSALKIHGTGESPKGQLKIDEAGKLSGNCDFKLDSLDTGISLRNEHMKKRYLETAKFPVAKLSVTEIKLPANYSAGDFSADLPFEGTLSLHGAEKPVKGTAKLARKGDELSFKAVFPLKTDDFGIKTPSFAGITMASDVNVSVDAKAPFKLAK